MAATVRRTTPLGLRSLGKGVIDEAKQIDQRKRRPWRRDANGMNGRIAELEKKQRQFEADAAYREALGRELLAQRVTH
jgi:hypothetical protein